MPGEPVLLFQYDLSNGMAQSLGPMLIGRALEGIWVRSSPCLRRQGGRKLDVRGKRRRNLSGSSQGTLGEPGVDHGSSMMLP